MRRILFIIIAIAPLVTFAQQPKMYIKVFGGTNVRQYIYRIEGVDSDIVPGWQVGAGFRVSYRKEFLEIDFTFIEHAFTLAPDEDLDLEIEEPVNIRMRSFELPLSLGYIPVKTPVYKLYLYGGIVNWFSLKGRLEYEGEESSFRAKELGLHVYNLGARFGTQFDIAMFNFDFNYTLGITNAFRNRARTNSHTLQFSVGLLF